MKTTFSRRSMMSTLVGGVAAMSMSARGLGLPIGLELYTVGKEMDLDPNGTLKQVAAAGYQEVETSPLSKIPARELRKMFDDNGVKNPAGHCVLPDLQKDLQGKIDQSKELGQEYLVVTVPWIRDMSRVKANPSDQMAFFMALLNALTLDDFKWTAEQFNKYGAEMKKAGLQLGYHNHNFEFKTYEGGVSGYDELLKQTDPELVKLEMDCGWMTVAGHDPVEYLKKYPTRYKLLHIKDFKKGFKPTHTLGQGGEGAPVPTELGRGSIDYRRIFAAAHNSHLRSIFVEQEPPFTEMPALEAIKVDYEYLDKLHA